MQRAAQFLQQAFQQAGMSVSINTIAQSTLINDALAGTYQATLWRQFGAVDPDLNYVWWTTQLASGPLALNMARNVDPRIQTALVAGRTTGVKAARVKEYQKVNQYLAEDMPYMWLARDTWAVVANPKVQNFANPKTPTGPRPSPSTRACSGRRRSGCSRSRAGSGSAGLAHLDVVEVLLAPVGVALLG